MLEFLVRSLDRRAFLGSSLGGLAACSLGSQAFAQAPAKAQPAEGEVITSALTPGERPGLDTLFLTWQGDPTTTMTVQWVGPPSDALVPVQFAPLNGDYWQTAPAQPKPFPNTELVVHRCELTGLTPGREYKLLVTGQAQMCRFRTMPAKATDTIQFVSGGDAGIRQHAINTNIIAAKQEPYFALLGGDLAYDNGTSPGTFLRFLQNYRRHMVDPQGRLVPMISCIGNHEVDGGYDAPRAKAPQYLSVFDGLFRDTTYGVLDIGDYLSLVLLDTGHVAPIGGEQTSWLERCLAERQDRPHLIVANHVPAYPSFRSMDPGEGETAGTGFDNRRYWVPLFEKYKVDVVLEHHDHTFKRTHPLTGGLVDPNGLVYLGDGSWGRLRVPNPPSDRPYLAAVSRAYHMTVHRLEGARRFHVALEESGRVADVCMTVNKRAAKGG